MQFGILGRLEVSTNGRAIEVKGPKQRALLLFLLLHPNQTVSTEVIIEALWGDELTGRDGATLRVHIANLRRALLPGGALEDASQRLMTRSPGYLLRIDPESIDATRFERLAIEGRRLMHDNAEQAKARLTDALKLWRGSALEDVAYETFAQAEIRRLEELRLSTVENLYEVRLAMDEHLDLVGDLESLVAIYPLRERLWGHLMLALYRSGRQADALAAYRRLADLLGQEHGLEPSPQLRLLEDRILVNDPTLLTTSLRLGSNRRPPAERTRLIGRAIQVAELQAKLRAAQLLTLTGTGGVGKTRLAQHLAWAQIEAGAEVWWVELGGLAEPRLVAEQIATAGGVSQGPDIEMSELLGRFLSERELVIVLDNCEHLVDECARLSDQLLTRAPALKLIVTTREPLQVQGELVWRVPSLPVPETTDEVDLVAFPSIELFLERAKERGIGIEPASLPAVATICRRLDGIPLAIELAAARVTTLTPEDISARLTDRFSLLERGGRTALARHRTLEAAIDWSFQLLSATDQRLLSRLAVFVEGFDMEAARDVCGFGPIAPDEVEVGIERLADKSMIEVAADPIKRRFRFTESIQAFAWDRLRDQPDELLQRHRDWALQLAVSGGKGILENEAFWFPRLEGTYAEFRAAFNESIRRREPEVGLQLVGSLGGFLLWRHVTDALEWLERAVLACEEQPSKVRPATMALGLLALGPYLCYHNRFEEGSQRLAAAAQLYTNLDHPQGLMWTRYQQSFFPVSGRPQECLEHAHASASLARQIARPVPMAYGLTRLAEAMLVASAHRDTPSTDTLQRVLAVCEEANAYCRELPHAYASGVAKTVMGSALALLGHEEQGFSLIDQGIAARTRFAISMPCSTELASAGQLALRLGYEDRARILLQRGLTGFKDVGLPYAARSALVGAAASLMKRNPTVASRVLGAANSLRPSFLYGSCIFIDEERVFEQVRAEIGEDAYLAELGHGQRLGARNAIDLAIAHLG